jgi:glyoxylase-like metal-dependent hydrolase (beta-lactamase superfamily II)
MLIAQGLEMLEISSAAMGRTTTINPALIWDPATVLLVDAGFPGQLPLFREAMAAAGVPFERLGAVILTHQDIDHLGGLPAILEGAPQKVEVLASETEKPYIQGEKQSVKMNPEAMAKMMASLPPEVAEARRKSFAALLANPPKAVVTRTVADGEELPYGGGVTVIATPGHTPGHVSVYHRSSKTLITGDAMVVNDGQLLGPSPSATADLATATRSLQKFTHFDIQAVICYHGGLYRGDANRRIAELASA